MAKLDQIIDRQPLVQEISIIFKTNTLTSDLPCKNPLLMIKVSFLQSLCNQSDSQLEAKGLMVKKGTIVDDSILPSSELPLSSKKPEELDTKPSSQFDTVAKSIKKGDRYFFGYKGHIGVCVESKLIRKATLTPANVHDSTQAEKLISYNEKSLFGDNAYLDSHHKYSARHYGWYYVVQYKATRSQPLSGSQKKRNRKLRSVRATVEHPFAWMKSKANLDSMRAKNRVRNQLQFVFICIDWYLNRAGFLLEITRLTGSVAV